MKSYFYSIVLVAFIYSVGCTSKNTEIKTEKQEVEGNDLNTYQGRLNEIDLYTKLMFDDSLNFNKLYAEKLLNAYDLFIKNDSYYNISKDYMFKAGELCRALDKPHDAIKYFNLLLEKDPKHKLAGTALFYKAMIIGDYLQENELAIETYKEFIQKYPNHELVESAKASIELQGKTMEEIIKGFKEKEKNV
ncbi:MAG: tetratricopeptide repeat protein [Flavobacteriales bacterium]|nr:tetratricopeptide repeat protein [Flavobacteriales bacterium]